MSVGKGGLCQRSAKRRPARVIRSEPGRTNVFASAQLQKFSIGQDVLVIPSGWRLRRLRPAIPMQTPDLALIGIECGRRKPASDQNLEPYLCGCQSSTTCPRLCVTGASSWIISITRNANEAVAARRQRRRRLSMGRRQTACGAGHAPLLGTQRRLGRAPRRR